VARSSAWGTWGLRIRECGLGNADYGALTIINGYTRLVHRKGTGPIRLEGQVVDAEFLQIGATQPTERRAAGKSNTNYY